MTKDAAQLQLVKFVKGKHVKKDGKMKGDSKTKDHKKSKKGDAKPIDLARRAEKTENRRFMYAAAAEPGVLSTYKSLGTREKARFREMWKDDPGFSYIQQFKSRTMSKTKADEDKEAIAMRFRVLNRLWVDVSGPG